MARLRGIDGLFLHCYLSVYRVKPRDLDLSQRGMIRNTETTRVIKESFRNYTNSGQNIEDYFDGQILHFQAPRLNRAYIANSDNVTRSPIIISSVKKGAGVCYSYGIPLSDLKINKPIKMSLKHIFAIYGITTAFDTSTNQGMFILEDMHSVNIHLYELNENDRGVFHSCLLYTSPSPRDS